MDPISSPPTEIPCTSLSRTRRKVAAIPMDSYVGRKPSSVVGIAIMPTDSIRAVLRPRRSPM